MAKKVTKKKEVERVIEFVLEEELEPVSSQKVTKVGKAVSKTTKTVKTKTKAEVKTKRTASKAKTTIVEPKNKVEAKLEKTLKIKTGNEQPTANEAGVETVGLKNNLKNTPAEIDFESRPPAFKELALPKLPVLEKQNRARLQVQSPNRMFFYWSLKSNPYQALNKSLGMETAGYTLALRMIDTETEREELHAVEPEGSYWFAADAGRTYRAEIGFYSPSRPFVRILFSNTVTTPRKSPSTRAADASEWRVTSEKFAEVLDVSGFEKDSFDVALAGDDVESSHNATHAAFTHFLGKSKYSRDVTSAEDIRYAMRAIASGRVLEELRWKIGAALFEVLQANAERIAAKNAAATLSEYFDIDEAEFEEEQFGPTAFGASAVHFPKKLKTKRRREYSPLSSRGAF